MTFITSKHQGGKQLKQIFEVLSVTLCSQAKLYNLKYGGWKEHLAKKILEVQILKPQYNMNPPENHFLVMDQYECLVYQIWGRNPPRLQRITADVISKHDDATGHCTAHNEAQTHLIHKQRPAIKSKHDCSDPGLLLEFCIFTIDLLL